MRRFGPRALAMIERQEWLDRPSYRLEHLLPFLFSALGRMRDRGAERAQRRLARAPGAPAAGLLRQWGAGRDSGNSFRTVLEAHADGQERDMIPVPPPVRITDAELEELGNKIAIELVRKLIRYRDLLHSRESP